MEIQFPSQYITDKNAVLTQLKKLNQSCQVIIANEYAGNWSYNLETKDWSWDFNMTHWSQGSWWNDEYRSLH